MAVGSGEPVSPWGAWSPRLGWAAAGGQVPVYLRPVAEPGNHVPMCSPSSLCCMGGSAGSHKSASRPRRPVPSVPRALPAPGFQRLQIDAIPRVHLRAGRPGGGAGPSSGLEPAGLEPSPSCFRLRGVSVCGADAAWTVLVGWCRVCDARGVPSAGEPLPRQRSAAARGLEQRSQLLKHVTSVLPLHPHPLVLT